MYASIEWSQNGAMRLNVRPVSNVSSARPCEVPARSRCWMACSRGLYTYGTYTMHTYTVYMYVYEDIHTNILGYAYHLTFAFPLIILSFSPYP